MICKKKVKINSILFVLGWILISYWIWYTPLMGDDLASTHISTISDIFKLSLNEYFTGNARFFGQVTTRFLVKYNGLFTAGISGLLFCLQWWLITKIGLRNGNATVIQYFVSLIFILHFSPAFAEVYLWRAGAGNYLYQETIALFFIYIFLFNHFWIRGNHLIRIFKISFSLLIAFISGFSSQNTGGAIVLVLILGLILEKYHNKAISELKIRLSLLIVYLFAYSLLIIAPGNDARMGDWERLTLFSKLKIGISGTINAIWHTHFIVLLLVMVGVFGLLSLVRRNWMDVQYGLVYVIGGVASIGVLSITPYSWVSERTFFGGAIFLVIGLISLIDFEKKKLEGTVLIVLCLFLLYRIGQGIIDSFETADAYKDRYQYIIKKMEKVGSDRVITIPKLNHYPTTKYGQHWEITSNYQDYPNVLYSTGFEIKGVKLSNE